MPSAYEGTDIISYLRSKYIMWHRRISYRASDISLKTILKRAIIQLAGFEFVKGVISVAENRNPFDKFQFA